MERLRLKSSIVDAAAVVAAVVVVVDAAGAVVVVVVAAAAAVVVVVDVHVPTLTMRAKITTTASLISRVSPVK